MEKAEKRKTYQKPVLQTFGGVGQLTQNIDTATGGDNQLKLGGKRSV